MKLKTSAALAFVVALSAAGVVAFTGRAEQTFKLPFSVWVRASETPIVSPQGTTWESAGTFNPAVVLHNGRIVMLYRAQDAAGTSRLGYAESKDGIHFTRRPDPVLAPEADYEKDGGVEDPRLQKFGDTYYLTYTGYNKKDAQLCLATSRDLIHWERKGVILPAYKGNWNKGWTKSGAIVPEKIDGKYWMYWLGTAADKTDQMGLSYSTDLVHWTEATETPVLPKRPGRFDSRVVEPGPPPLLTSRGIVLIYNGADDQLVYRTGVAVFDSRDPRKVLSRSDTPIFAPEKEWEKVGQVPNVVFVEGMVKTQSLEDVAGQRDYFLFYYGAADKYVGFAESRELQDSAPSSPPLRSPFSDGEVVAFPSGELTLHGVLYKPQGVGPFPAVVYNHGSAPCMLSKQAFDALGPDQIAVAGNSFGGIEAVLGAEHGSYCAAIDSAGGAQGWAQALELQSLMTRSVRNSRAPENDYDLSPSRVLSNAMKEVDKEFELKIYPPFGTSVQDGHTFGYFGSSVWADDVFRFLNKNCKT